MKPNVGPGDRVVRIVAGIVILAAGVYFHSYWGLIGLVPLATGFMRWCPVYIPFKITTK